MRNGAGGALIPSRAIKLHAESELPGKFCRSLVLVCSAQARAMPAVLLLLTAHKHGWENCLCNAQLPAAISMERLQSMASLRNAAGSLGLRPCPGKQVWGLRLPRASLFRKGSSCGLPACHSIWNCFRKINPVSLLETILKAISPFSFF